MLNIRLRKIVAEKQRLFDIQRVSPARRQSVRAPVHVADAHIHLSNRRLGEIERGKVSASMLYSAARFNAWVSACGFESAERMAAARAETIEYFLEQYRKMLETNLDDYISHFEDYMNSGDDMP